MKRPWPPGALRAWRLYRRLARYRNWEELISWTLAGALFLYIAAGAPVAIGRFLSSGSTRQEIRKAKSLGWTYERVRQDAQGAHGQLVYWHVLRSGDHYYYDENYSMPVSWEGAPPPDAAVGYSWRAHGANILAEVREVRPNEVVLAYRDSD